MDEDDSMIHQQLQAPSTGRVNRIRVSMGEINIEIESNSSPRITSSPRVMPRSSPPRMRDGANSRRTIGGEIPSTPGSSPIKMKAESSRGGEEDIVGDVRQDSEDILDEHRETSPVSELMDMDEDLQETLEDEEDDVVAMGPDTQALFEDDDFTIPQLDLTPSPHKKNGNTSLSTSSKFLTNTDDWVTQKANRYNVDQELIWWIVERTTGRLKLAIKTLKSFRKKNGNPAPQSSRTNG
jgi:hypothetical protein